MKRIITILVLLSLLISSEIVWADDGFNRFLNQFQTAVQNQDINALTNYISTDCIFSREPFFRTNPNFKEKIQFIITNRQKELLAVLNKGYGKCKLNNEDCYIFPKSYAGYVNNQSTQQPKFGSYVVEFKKRNGRWKMTMFAQYSM